MYEIREHNNLVQDFKGQSNENSLEIYKILRLIKKSELWTIESYYKNQNVYDYKEYSKMDFHTFIKEVFGITGVIFESINKILSLDDGRDLIIKYGRSNMVTYTNSTEPERIAILNEIEKSKKISPFNVIKRKLYPNANKTETPVSIWEKKYRKIQKEHNSLKKEHDKMKKEFDSYKKTVESLMNGLKKVG